MLQSAEARRDASLRSYVQSQLEYGKLWRLLEFGEKLDKLLQVCVGVWGAVGGVCLGGWVNSWHGCAAGDGGVLGYSLAWASLRRCMGKHTAWHVQATACHVHR
jgi:hypothetical protein